MRTSARQEQQLFLPLARALHYARQAFSIILADLVRLLRLRLVYIAKSHRITQTFQFLALSGLPGYTALVEAKALRALLILG